MQKIKGYSIATGGNPSDLYKEVNKAIENGWQPFGSPFVKQSDDDCDARCSQALVIYDDGNIAREAAMKKGEISSLEFHIESQDYFGTLATVLSLFREQKTQVAESIIDDLMYLQRNYKIEKK